jgi:ribonuclease P/MRP protein subunit POP7
LIKRPLPNLSIVRQLRKASVSHAPTTDLDGYQLPPRAAHTILIKVTAKTPLVATIKRARKALDLAPGTQKTKGLPLTQRIESLAVNTSNSKEQSQGGISDALDDVVLVATGKAIERAFQAAFILRRNKELIVIFRTRTVSSIDDIVIDDDDDNGADVDMEDQVRVRHMSCVEIGVRWK